ncbi:hypothetical protein [Zarconia navalis]|uniref:hypothetical protein n=1 Tax=Zarconia navalis TaxID=2992134 RepID=UPI0021F8FB5D|nr:hypothetical protein [Zarconia navalis]
MVRTPETAQALACRDADWGGVSRERAAVANFGRTGGGENHDDAGVGAGIARCSLG